MSRDCFIYSLEYPEGNIRYVGKTIVGLDCRLRNHLIGSNKAKTHKNNWVKKVLREGAKPIIRHIDTVSETEWQFWEQYWISQFRVWGFSLTNTTHGGDGLSGYSHKSSTKNKQSIRRYEYLRRATKRSWNQGLKNFESDETREKRSNSLKGHAVTQEQIEKSRKTRIQKGIWKSPEIRQQERLLEGKRVREGFISRTNKYAQIDPISLQVIREFNVYELREFYTQNERNRIRDAQLKLKKEKKFSLIAGYYWSLAGQDLKDIRMPGEDNKRRVAIDQFDLNGDFIKTWNSVSEAECFYNKKRRNNIVNTCRNAQKTAYNFKWRYHE